MVKEIASDWWVTIHWYAWYGVDITTCCIVSHVVQHYQWITLLSCCYLAISVSLTSLV